MKSVALVTSAEFPHLTESDRLLIQPLKDHGFKPHAVCWDEDIDWKQFDTVILRSCWDYHTRVKEFLNWLHMLELQKIPVWNPVSVVLGNYKKTYLKELEAKGIPIVPTVWLETNSYYNLKDILLSHQWERAIIKPTVGSGAYNLMLINRDKAAITQEKLDLLLKQSDVMIQPFFKEIQTVGELSIVFIGGQYSHTVLKRPKGDEIRSNDNYGAIEKLVQPSKEVLQEAIKIYQTVQYPLLYARVDGIIVKNIFRLMEFELIEPSLFLQHFSQGAATFADAFTKLSAS